MAAQFDRRSFRVVKNLVIAAMGVVGVIQPPWVTYPDISRSFKIYVEPSTSSLPRTLVFFKINFGKLDPPLQWFVERLTDSGWVGVGITAGSRYLRQETSNGVTASPEAGLEPPFGGSDLVQGEVLPVLFDTRGLFPNTRYRFSTEGLRFETTIKISKYPVDFPDQTGFESRCKSKSDRFPPGTTARRYDNTAPTKWTNVQGLKCGALPKGTYMVKGRNTAGFPVTSYFRTDLLG